MPDITLHITTKNLSPSELQKLHRDIALLKRGFTEARRAALIFGNQIETTFKQIQTARNLFIGDSTELPPQNIVANALNSIRPVRFASPELL